MTWLKLLKNQWNDRWRISWRKQSLWIMILCAYKNLFSSSTSIDNFSTEDVFSFSFLYYDAVTFIEKSTTVHWKVK